MNSAKEVQVAIQRSDIEYVKNLIKEGIDVNKVYTTGDYYIDRRYSDYEAEYFEYEDTLLSMAIRHNQIEIIKLILEAGANPNLKVDGITPLHRALNWDYIDIADILVKAGADFDEVMLWDDYYHIEKFMFIAARHRIKKFKEELIRKAWHPKRMTRWLEAGALDMMIGC